MRFYLTQAKDEGIRVEVSLPLPKQLPVPESDVCVLLGNLLENALSACRKLSPSQDRHIRVHGLFTPPHALSFTVDNSFCPQSNKIQSSEQSETVRSTAARLGGTAKFEQTETEFRASVLLLGTD